jgi:hypothetical protein
VIYGKRYGFWKMPKHIYDSVLTMMKEKQRKELIDSILNSLDSDEKKRKEKQNLVG